MRISGATLRCREKWADLSRLKKEQPPKLIRNERNIRDELPTLINTYGLKRTSLQRLNFGRDAVAFSSRRCLAARIVSSWSSKQRNRNPIRKAAGRHSYVRSTAMSKKTPVQDSRLTSTNQSVYLFQLRAGCHLSRLILNKKSFKLDVPHRYFRTTVFLFCLFRCLFGCVRRRLV